ncbi:nucleotide exchange factor GrpE [Streptomyces thinghirensis]|nr:nucleotide exchange factor GrpE [Streptomyces thinghirensis]
MLADTRRRAGALQGARSARETASAAIALGEQIDAAHRMLRGEFARHDVAPMDVVGRTADPATMRVVGTEPHPTRPHGTVLRERITGFRMGAATLRPAQVVIAVPGPRTSSPGRRKRRPGTLGPRDAPGRRQTVTAPAHHPRPARLPRKPSAGRGRRPAAAAEQTAAPLGAPYRTLPSTALHDDQEAFLHTPTLGIDLGTTNSVAAWLHDGVPTRPVQPARRTGDAVGGRGRRRAALLLVGREALNWRNGDPLPGDHRGRAA